jgi:hypothetical protein
MIKQCNLMDFGKYIARETLFHGQSSSFEFFVGVELKHQGIRK